MVMKVSLNDLNFLVGQVNFSGFKSQIVATFLDFIPK